MYSDSSERNSPEPATQSVPFFQRFASPLFYGFWSLITLAQAGFTELLHDEAYYWLYSRQLDWGYFDHPPMIALMIKAGFGLLKNELGTRLFSGALLIGTCFLMEHLTQPKNKVLFYALLSSVAAIHFIGFLAIPDVPLLFFTALFFFLFRAFIGAKNLLVALLLGAGMSLLLYSKYHGILVIGFSVLSMPGLLKNKKFLFASVFGAILFVPHLWWQWQNDFPSVSYHFSERSSGDGFDLSALLEYVAFQPLIYGPFVGFWLVYALFFSRSENALDRALKFSGWGIFLFFLLMTFKGRVEANWTLPAFVPMVYFGYRKAERSLRFQKALFLLFPATIFFFLLARVHLAYPLLPEKWQLKNEFHNNRAWAGQIAEIADNRPVAFMNSYQQASKYAFYSGKNAFSLNNAMGRRNQFTLWDTEAQYQGKTVIVIPNYRIEGLPEISTPRGTVQYVAVENFVSFGNFKVEPVETQFSLISGDSLSIAFRLVSLIKNPRNPDRNPDLPSVLSFVVFDKKKKRLEEPTSFVISNAVLEDNQLYQVKIAPDLAPGRYQLYLCLKTGWLPSGLNSRAIPLHILKK